MVDKNSSVPLYSQLVDLLINEITENLEPNSKMMSEREICERYDLSRTTVRLALGELENLGYIYKQHGKGTFVSEGIRDRKNLLESYSFTDYMRQLNKEPKTMVVAFEEVPLYRHIAQVLGVREGELAYRMERIRYADDVPMMFEVSYIPEYLFKSLSIEMLYKKPLYEVFREDYRQDVAVADEEFAASIMTDKESKLLETMTDALCLRIQRKSYNKQNIMIEYTVSVAKNDEFVYRVRHSR
ncbi:HTH-type transcriptional repressor YvoA [Paraliobacillus sp. PM-2]|uniref:GntR family transcriptional regulator n=1 Tax=Paraliobacillus sp. PM-2 TaxID=1462524 RepID=UPI00061C31C0|nr:GntR family transcriptional regulator [Paraliobacillus sp. PM-2]CQR46280.1 HTH-type transcriptional repressor YvoA [Paraliobacillus sp. PM-2]